MILKSLLRRISKLKDVVASLREKIVFFALKLPIQVFYLVWHLMEGGGVDSV